MGTLGLFLDAGIVGFMLFQTLLGWRRGLLWQAAGMASVLFGVALGWWLGPYLSGPVSEHITSNPFHARLIAFLFVAGVVGLVLRVAAACAEVYSESGLPPDECERRRKKDRVLGGMFGAVKGGVQTALLVATAIAICPQHAIWRKSYLAQPLAVAGARLLPEGAVDEIREWAAKSKAELEKKLAAAE